MKRLWPSTIGRLPMDSSFGWLRTSRARASARFVIVTLSGRSTTISLGAHTSSSARATPSRTS